MSELEQALAALERGELEVALDALLEAWRRSGDGETVALAERLGRQLAAPDLASGEPVEQRQQAWLRRARQPRSADLPSLLRGFTSGTSPQLLERVDALCRWRPDPRIARAVADLGERRLLLDAWERQYWARLRRALPHADLAVVDRLAALLVGSSLTRSPRAQAAAALAARRQELEALPPLDDESQRTRSRFAALLERRFPHLSPEAAAAIEDFLAGIRAAPDDDERRMVFADWLIERGDARGELINLQYQRLRHPLSPAQAAREAELLAGRTAEWLGPLASIAEGITFDRGFPAHYRCLPDHQHDARALIGCAAWATVREVDFDYYGMPPWAVELLRDPAMRGLRAAGNLTDEVAIALAETLVASAPSPLEEIGLLGPTVERGRAVLDALSVAAAAAPEGALPRLRRLHLGLTLTGGVDPPPSLRWIGATALGARLEQLSLGCDLTRLGEWLDEAPRLPPALLALRLRPVGDGAVRGRWWHVTLRRDDQHAFTRLDAVLVPVDEPWDTWGELTRALERVDAGALTSVEVTIAEHGVASDEAASAVERAARRQRRLTRLVLPR